jgi:ribonuclease HII
MIIGVDEAGRGPVIGPMVIAGVLTDHDTAQALSGIGVKDSKKLSPKRREELSKAISSKCQVHMVILTARDIDEQRKKESLNMVEARVYAAIIAELLGRLTPADAEGCEAYVDAVDVNEGRYGDTIRACLPEHFKGVKIISKHKADDTYPVVSAASVMAKTRRDAEVSAIARELGCDLGSGYPADPVTERFLRDWLKTHKDLPPYVRRSWDTVKRLLGERDTKYKTLDTFT